MMIVAQSFGRCLLAVLPAFSLGLRVVTTSAIAAPLHHILAPKYSEYTTTLFNLSLFSCQHLSNNSSVATIAVEFCCHTRHRNRCHSFIQLLKRGVFIEV